MSKIFEVKAVGSFGGNDIFIRLDGVGEFRRVDESEFEELIESTDGDWAMEFSKTESAYPGSVHVSFARKEPNMHDDDEDAAEHCWMGCGGFHIIGQAAPNTEVYYVLDTESDGIIQDNVDGYAFEWQEACNEHNYVRVGGEGEFQKAYVSETDIFALAENMISINHLRIGTTHYFLDVQEVKVLVPNTCIYTENQGFREVAKARVTSPSIGNLFVRWNGETARY